MENIFFMQETTKEISCRIFLMQFCIYYHNDTKFSDTHVCANSVNPDRIRATGRHYRQMRIKNIFGTKNHYLVKTSGEKKSPLKKSAPKNAT